MKRKILASAAAVALFTIGGVEIAAAQQAGAGSSGSSQTGTPPATTTPGTTLPEVQVIQEQQKAKPKPVKQAAKPKKKPTSVAVAPIEPAATQVPAVDEGSTEVKMSPIGGSEIPLDKVPGGVSTVSQSDIASTRSVIPQDYLAQRVPGVIVSDIQGNGFQTDVQFRGFESSPVNGVAQGLAVYQNGVRINEAFGDIVNYDFLPEDAIRSVTVMSGNPVFGLNALGGAISFDMQDGFHYHGAEFDVRGGSNGRIQGSAQAGMQSGNYAAYVAVENINDEGWREFSPTYINRMYGDLGVKGDGSEFHLNFSGADNSYGVTAAAPEQLLDLGWDRAFTSPQVTDNTMEMVSINGSTLVTPTTTVSGVAYYRHFKQTHIDGNIADFDYCNVGPGGPLDTSICDDDGPLFGGKPGEAPHALQAPDLDSVLGSIDKTSQDADSFGGSLQAVDKSKWFGHNNQFLIGTSYDHGHVIYSTSSEVGTFAPHFVVVGDGDTISGGTDPGPPPVDNVQNDFTPRHLITTNDYFGLYFSDTFDVTSLLSVTAGGRYNYARVAISDQLDPTDSDLNSANVYERFNPAIGATYKLVPGISLYGGYSEANRAPTPGESACADPDEPCLIESFLTADPPLKQVVSRTWELGLRGDHGRPGDHLEWSAGLFRTANTNDIVTMIANDGTRGFFLNATDTLRQGVEASMQYTTERYRVYASYNYTDATFTKGYEQFSPNNPNEGTCIDPAQDGCIEVMAGDHIPGVPAHKFKAGFDYWVTPKWKFGSDLIATSGQYLYGDENNSNPKLAGYAKVNLHTSYDITDHIQLYGLVDNLFDAHFGTYGTFFDTGEASDASVGENITFTNARTITPSQPFAAYGGLKVKF